jgi:hypothetical protein
MEFDLKTIAYILGGIVAGAGGLTVFAIKNPDAHATVVEPRLDKLTGLLWAWSFGAQLLAIASRRSSQIEGSRGGERNDVVASRKAIALVAMQLWLNGVARDGRKLKQPIDGKE